MTYYAINQPQNDREGYGVIVIDIRIVRNISSNYQVVKNLIDECNSNELSAVHFDDVLENYLSDGKTF